MAELASEYEVHPPQIMQWRKQLLELLPEIFNRRRENDQQEQEKLMTIDGCVRWVWRRFIHIESTWFEHKGCASTGYIRICSRMYR